MKKFASQRFGNDVFTVMAMRISALPLWWLTDPVKADHETRKMFSEKHQAFMAMQQTMMQSPMMFWMDCWRGVSHGDADGGIARARAAAERRLMQPYRSRVTANRKRLSRGG